MVKSVVLLVLLSSAIPAFAQNVQTLYHRNGQKALEGKWTYLSAGIPTMSAVDVVVRRIKMEREDDEADEFRTIEQISIDPTLLHLKCEGLITGYYENGAKRVEILFAKGLPYGPVTKYYSNGHVAMQGSLQNGMPNGEWKFFYKSGKPFYTGSYVPFTQQELHNDWQLRVEGSWDKMEAALTADDALFNEASAEAQATTAARQQFGYFIDKLLQSGKKDGTFLFYAQNGRMLAQLSYKSGIRVGTWKTGDALGNTLFRLDYRNGLLISVGDRDEKPLGISAYVERWRSAGGKVHVLEDAAPTPQQERKREQ